MSFVAVANEMAFATIGSRAVDTILKQCYTNDKKGSNAGNDNDDFLTATIQQAYRDMLAAGVQFVLRQRFPPHNEVQQASEKCALEFVRANIEYEIGKRRRQQPTMSAPTTFGFASPVDTVNTFPPQQKQGSANTTAISSSTTTIPTTTKASSSGGGGNSSNDSNKTKEPERPVNAPDDDKEKEESSTAGTTQECADSSESSSSSWESRVQALEKEKEAQSTQVKELQQTVQQFVEALAAIKSAFESSRRETQNTQQEQQQAVDKINKERFQELAKRLDETETAYTSRVSKLEGLVQDMETTVKTLCATNDTGYGPQGSLQTFGAGHGNAAKNAQEMQTSQDETLQKLQSRVTSLEKGMERRLENLEEKQKHFVSNVAKDVKFLAAGNKRLAESLEACHGENKRLKTQIQSLQGKTQNSDNTVVERPPPSENRLEMIEESNQLVRAHLHRLQQIVQNSGRKK